AIALRQRGFEPVLFEQADRLKEVGAGIQITPNSTRILRALGLEGAVRKGGFEPGFMVMRDMITGEVLFRTQAKGAMAERFGAGWFQIHRADLLDILMSAGRCRYPPECILCCSRARGKWCDRRDRRGQARAVRCRGRMRRYSFAGARRTSRRAKCPLYRQHVLAGAGPGQCVARKPSPARHEFMDGPALAAVARFCWRR